MPTAPPGGNVVGESTSVAGDGGVGWLRKALKRCEEQAQEEGRSVEEVAAQRYGVSLCAVTTGIYHKNLCSVAI